MASQHLDADDVADKPKHVNVAVAAGPTQPPAEQIHNHKRAGCSTTASSSTQADPEKLDTSREAIPSEDEDSSPNTLAWDGADDPENPMNWPPFKRHMQVIITAAFSLTANLAATMFAPGAAQLAAEFGVTNSAVISLTVSIYLFGFAVGPLLLAPMSEIYGRLPIYAGAGVCYIAFLIACAFATNMASFIVFRLLCGCAAAASIAVGGGTLADVTPVEKRPKWMTLFVMGPLLGPVIGPIAGGFITENVGWRWDFRVLLIASGVLVLLSVAYLRETYAPTILRRRAKRRTGQGAMNRTGPVLASHPGAANRIIHDLTRPMRLLATSPIVLFLSLYCAFAFGLIFLLFTTFPTVFGEQYGFSIGIAGLTYLGLGAGMFIGLFAQQIIGQKIVNSLTKKRGGSRPEDRLALMAYSVPALPAGMFWYAWSVEKQTHWIVPILGNVLVGLGVVCILMPPMVYLVQIYGAESGASALAANTVFRCAAGAFLPLAGPALYSKLGLGWGNSLLGFLAIAFAPVPWVLYLYGDRIRSSGTFKL